MFSAPTAPTLPPRPLHTAVPTNYCAIPQRLLTDLRDTPLAIGLYALAARLFLVHQSPVPLSRADILRYDPTLKPGAVKRAFDRLLAGGWLLDAPASAGRKQRYTPTWGRVKGEPLPWRMDAPCLGRPRHIVRLLLDRVLLDVCMGKLAPHATQPATVTRYVTSPALGLADIGTYALALGSIPGETVALRRLGLLRNGQTLPVPSEPRLLALLSQRALDLDDSPVLDATLTTSGTRRLGIHPAPTASDSAQPLFFIPPGLIGKPIGALIGFLIGSAGSLHPTPAAAASAEMPRASQHAGITWDSGNTGNQTTPPPTPSHSHAAGGGKEERSEQKRPARRRAHPQAAPSVPATPATELLGTINVLPETRVELADLPVETVKAAIQDAQAREGIRDLAGWVVKLLRTHRDHGWKIAPPRARAESAEDLRAAFARLAAEQEAARHVELSPEQAWFPQPAPALFYTHGSLTRLWNEVQAALKAQAPRADWEAWLRRLTLVCVESGVATIMAPTALAKQVVEDRYLGLLRELLLVFAGDTLSVHVVLNPHALPQSLPSNTSNSSTITTQHSTPTSQPPAWIAPERWATLPAMLRAALLGSELVDGAVQCCEPHFERVVQRYARELEELRAAV